MIQQDFTVFCDFHDRIVNMYIRNTRIERYLDLREKTILHMECPECHRHVIVIHKLMKD